MPQWCTRTRTWPGRGIGDLDLADLERVGTVEQAARIVPPSSLAESTFLQKREEAYRPLRRRPHSKPAAPHAYAAPP